MKTPMYLLDTNICVFFLRNKYGIKDKIKQIGVERCCLSEIVVAELLYGAYFGENAETVQVVKDFIKWFTILSISDAIEEYSLQKAILRHKGLLIDDMDLLIGATAIVNGCILVTDNSKHFNRLERIKLINWVER